MNNDMCLTFDLNSSSIPTDSTSGTSLLPLSVLSRDSTLGSLPSALFIVVSTLLSQSISFHHEHSAQIRVRLTMNGGSDTTLLFSPAIDKRIAWP